MILNHTITQCLGHAPTAASYSRLRDTHGAQDQMEEIVQFVRNTHEHNLGVLGEEPLRLNGGIYKAR